MSRVSIINVYDRLPKDDIKDTQILTITKEQKTSIFNRLSNDVDKNFEIRTMNVKDIEEKWEKDYCYISDYHSKHCIQEKYIRAQKFMLNTQNTINLSEISIENEVISFEDGRHRFCVLRDWGFDKIKIKVCKEELIK